ncbi:MAG: hypothetical protein ABI411_19160 [Tahibacter sp.]
MPDWLLTVRDICIFRRGPQDLPHAPQLMLGVLVLGTVFDVAVGALMLDRAGALTESLVSSGFSAAVMYALLRLRQRGSRFVQAFLAQLSCGLALSMLLLPLLWIMGPPPASPDALTPMHGLIALAILSVMLWLLAVNSHIFRHALDVPPMVAFFVATLWMISQRALSTVLFGDGAGG